MTAPPLLISDEVRAALDAGRAVVALESSLIAQGLPVPHNLETALGPAPAETDARLRHLFLLVTSRAPDEVEMTILRDALQEHLTRFRANPKGAQELVRVGETQPAPSMSAEELAAWTMLGNLVLNLDEVINR